jgi:hypothetical protein
MIPVIRMHRFMDISRLVPAPVRKGRINALACVPLIIAAGSGGPW